MNDTMLHEATTKELIDELVSRCEACMVALVTKENWERDGDFNTLRHGPHLLQSGLLESLRSALLYRTMRDHFDWDNKREE